jgi:dTDP-glucose 4,6-dehydratase
LEELSREPRILITGGGGFIGSALIRKLLKDSTSFIFNIDKLSDVSDLSSINELIATNNNYFRRYKFIKLDLVNESETNAAVSLTDPDYIIHLAAESHVDKSIKTPTDCIYSNIIGTLNILESARNHYNNLDSIRKFNFRFLHISTDEVFGSINSNINFCESTKYDPRNPYSASKASSDHLVNAWHHTYGLPVITTHCSNNYGPWQNPEKLIPKIIFCALNNLNIPIYGDGENVRDWIFVEDHVNGLLKVLNYGKTGESYCMGGNEKRTNNEVVNAICEFLDNKDIKKGSFKSLIRYVDDRAGHDRCYSTDFSKMKKLLNWEPVVNFKDGLNFTINWYLGRFIKNFKN